MHGGRTRAQQVWSSSAKGQGPDDGPLAGGRTCPTQAAHMGTQAPLLPVLHKSILAVMHSPSRAHALAGPLRALAGPLRALAGPLRALAGPLRARPLLQRVLCVGLQSSDALFEHLSKHVLSHTWEGELRSFDLI
eukprot:TRINITY_DN4813_c0_g1_i2.p1 TRINITY_DN4813_c0_g1~~TRINITY_DN4813_c0_g1_i2.p1  ORF type:complete len:135 (+),score=12.64 TRINITY_DN4813_c0_g1_i2:413-817(+)